MQIYRHEPQPIQRAIERRYEQLGIDTRSIALEDVPVLLERDARTIILAELESPLLARMTPTEMTAVQRYTQLATTALWVTDGGIIQEYSAAGAYAKLKEFMALMAHKHPRLSILELGAGTGGATKIMLNALEGDSQLPKYESYIFTDVSKAFLGVAQERFQANSHLNFGILDIENESTGQGFDENSFDVVFASNVSIATVQPIFRLLTINR